MLPIGNKNLLKSFRAGSWGHSASVQAFLEQAGDYSGRDLVKLLEVLVTRAVPNDSPAAHKNRCRAFAELVIRAPDPGLFHPFVQAIKTCDAHLRETLAALLPKVDNVSHHGALCALLDSKDRPVREAAAAVLEQIGKKQAFDTLADLSRKPSFLGRLEAMRVMVAIGGPYAVAPLAEVLKAGSTEERLAALRHLGSERFVQADLRGVLDAVRIALADRAASGARNEAQPSGDGWLGLRPAGARQAGVASEAIRVFSAFASEDDWFETVGAFLEAHDVELVMAAVKGLTRFRSLRAAHALETAFRAGPNDVRIAVLETAKATGDPSLFDLLVEAVNHRHQAIQNLAAEVIVDLAASEKIEVQRAIVWLLKSRDETVRRMAADIAHRMGERAKHLWPELLRFLRDEDWWVRERVADALVEMAGRQLTPYVVPYLQDPSDVVRRFAIGVITRLKDPAALGVLVRSAMEDPDWWTRELAIGGMAVLGDPRAGPYIVNLMARDKQLRRACIEALEQIGAMEAAPYVAGVLNDEQDADVALAALRCLDKLDDPRQLPYLKPLANVPDAKIRGKVRELLARWDPQGHGAQTTRMGQQLELLDQLLYTAHQADADDLLIGADRPPSIKRGGRVMPLHDRVMTREEIEGLLTPILTASQRERMAELEDADLSYKMKSHDLRFRVNVFRQLTGMAAVFRRIKDEIPALDTLGLPDVVRRFGDLKNGLVLIGGPTGSGKSTTLAAVIDYINRTSARHILTLEDPIEVVHRPKTSMLTQREIGTHSKSFTNALKATLRQDPDVILVGEMRDLPTIAFAITAAETGHLVFGTLHTVSADQSVDRLINAFPPGQQPQVRSMLSGSLRAVACQHLLTRIDSKGRVLAVEVMVNTPAIANLIRNEKTFQIPSVIATSRGTGMQTMDSELLRLCTQGVISAEEAYVKANNKKEFEALFEQEGRGSVELSTAPPEPTRPPAVTTGPQVALQPSLHAGPEVWRQPPPPAAPHRGAEPPPPAPPAPPSFSTQALVVHAGPRHAGLSSAPPSWPAGLRSTPPTVPPRGPGEMPSIEVLPPAPSAAGRPTEPSPNQILEIGPRRRR